MREDDQRGTGPGDVELVRRGRSGDTDALGALAMRHHAASYRVALSIVGDGDLAQDIVQDAFVKAFRGLGAFREDASFRTWLLTITANEAKGMLRRRKRRSESALEEVGPIASGERDAAQEVATRGEAARARSMLARLPEKQRMSVTLRVEEGLSFREIGDVIGSSEGAARVNYFHGIRRLRELMG